ncbi:MAG: HAD hydrolase-like protein [Angelakisella sp.]|nr:HAD hydrolase-like protein [Angelakisella sp.]
MGYGYFIYDLDGTVLDTSPGILATLRQTEEVLGIAPLPFETLLKFVGPPLIESFATYYGANQEQSKLMVDTYRGIYLKTGVTNAKIYDFMTEGLEFARKNGAKTAIATLKYEKMARLNLDTFGLSGYFDFVAGQREGEEISKARSIAECLKALNCTDKSKAVFIGDSRYDGIGAMEAGVDFVPLTYGFGFADPESLCGIPFVAKAAAPKNLFDFIVATCQKQEVLHV